MRGVHMKTQRQDRWQSYLKVKFLPLNLRVCKMFGFEQCCDASGYRGIGVACLADVHNCWDKVRPIGAILSSALFGDKFLLFNHLLLLVFAVYLIGSEAGIKLKVFKTTLSSHQLLIKALGAFLLLEFTFVGLASVYLTDVTAGIFAAFAILAFMRKNTIILAIAGAISVLIRAAYLYPMLVLIIFYLAESFYQKRKEGALVAIFFICIAPQYISTYSNTGIFSFIDATATTYWQNFHLSSNSSGYDTILFPDRGFHRVESGSVGLLEGYKNNQWMAIGKLIMARMNFYFFSFVPYNKVYLLAPSERIYSIFIGISSLMTLIFSIVYLKSRAWRIGLPMCLLLAQSLIIIPEQRFIFVIQLFLVMFTYLYLLGNIWPFLNSNLLNNRKINAAGK